MRNRNFIFIDFLGREEYVKILFGVGADFRFSLWGRDSFITASFKKGGWERKFHVLKLINIIIIINNY